MKLLIYIPSYNRSSALNKQLDVIIGCKQKESITVIVKDNCSSDPDYSIIEEKCGKSGFVYYRNICNVGGNPNILEGFTHSNKADYTWILSDDDTLSENAIEKIIEILSSKQPDILYMTHSSQEEKTVTAFEKDIPDIINDGLGLISLVIYRSEYVTNSVRAGFDNLYSCFPHLAVLFDAIKKNGSLKLCRIGKENFFDINSHYEKPAEGISGYNASFFGFLHLTAILSFNVKKRILKSWWSSLTNQYKFIKLFNQYPQHSFYAYYLLKDNIFLFNFKLILAKIIFPIQSIAYNYLKSQKIKNIS